MEYGENWEKRDSSVRGWSQEGTGTERIGKRDEKKSHPQRMTLKDKFIQVNYCKLATTSLMHEIHEPAPKIKPSTSKINEITSITLPTDTGELP